MPYFICLDVVWLYGLSKVHLKQYVIPLNPFSLGRDVERLLWAEGRGAGAGGSWAAALRCAAPGSHARGLALLAARCVAERGTLRGPGRAPCCSAGPAAGLPGLSPFPAALGRCSCVSRSGNTGPCGRRVKQCGFVVWRRTGSPALVFSP